jgi:hypothetical protein
VFGFARDPLEADYLARRAAAAMPAGSDVTVAEPANDRADVWEETRPVLVREFETEWSRRPVT